MVAQQLLEGQNEDVLSVGKMFADLAKDFTTIFRFLPDYFAEIDLNISFNNVTQCWILTLNFNKHFSYKESLKIFI